MLDEGAWRPLLVRLWVSINTIRSQVRALFRKTETERQAELINLLARLQGL